MKTVNSYRVFKRNDKSVNKEGAYVLYWMQTNHRLHYNYALEYAAAWANKLGKPLLIYEELSCDYRWASDRIHTFYLQGMAEHAAISEKENLNYLPVVEKKAGESRKVLKDISKKACCLITDEYPVFFIRDRNNGLGDMLDIMVKTVDSNGIIPLGMTDKDPYSAYHFRKIVQRNFIECYTAPPLENPLELLENTSVVSLPAHAEEVRNRSIKCLEQPAACCSALDIRHDVTPVEYEGTRTKALNKLDTFIQKGLQKYGEERNDPDAGASSEMSPWLHFGKISEYEIVKAVLECQPKGWDLDDITYNKGSTGGFFNGDPNVDSFLDEVITWRGVGFHFAHHRPDYAEFESLPDWALETLKKHEADPREWVYSFEELEKAQTHDEIWNAAQTQLRQEGIIHNYLRMLWGKKVIEWTPDPGTALDYLIELNNLYAIDGRDPNSYSGIFWCFGRFDRAWQERPVFGKIRYMTSKSTRRKVKLKEYLAKYGSQQTLDM